MRNAHQSYTGRRSVAFRGEEGDRDGARGNWGQLCFQLKLAAIWGQLCFQLKLAANLTEIRP
jgi:hypothetical protein